METVNLTHFFPWAFIMHFIRALIVFNISNSVLKNKFNTGVTFAAVVIPGMIYSAISLQFVARQNELFFMFCYYIMMFIILTAVTNGTLFSKFFAAVYSLVTYLTSSFMYTIVFGVLFGVDISAGFDYEIPLSIFITNIVFTYSFSFIFVVIIRLICSKRENAFSPKTKYTLFLVFPITHIFGSIQACSALINVHENSSTVTLLNEKNVDICVILFSAICLAADFALVLFIDKFEKIEEKNIETQKEIMKNSIDYNQIQMLKKEKSEFRKIKHDYINIITTAKGFIEINKPEKAYEFLSEINNDLLGIAGFFACSNETINTILYIKMQQAENAGIELDVEIKDEFGVLINDYDLCRLLSNIVDNALNAVTESGLKNPVFIKISITEEKIKICSTNEFNAEKKKRKTENHGNGIGIIKEIAAKYNGSYSSNQSDGFWKSETVLDNVPPPEKKRTNPDLH